MRPWTKFFDSKLFGATVVGIVSLGTFEVGIHRPELLVVPVLAVIAYWFAFHDEPN